MNKSISIKMETYVHMVDALNAARMAGLKSETEQLAFDESLKQAGGMMNLIQKTGLHKADGRMSI